MAEKKPFLVRIEFELAVMADSCQQAEDYLFLRKFAEQEFHAMEFSAIASSLSRYPDGWDDDCLVYNADSELSLKQAMQKEPHNAT